MKFTQSGGETVRGPEAWFTGDVYIEGIGNPDAQTAIGSAHVRFSPGARTAWHSHPKGPDAVRHRRYWLRRQPWW
jgi:quercetin dioxygenase-like cupin family protein